MNRIIILSFFFLILIAFAFGNLNNLLIFIDSIFKYSLIENYYSIKIIIFTIIYSLSICLLLPLGLVLMPLGGYFFGAFQGFIICNFSLMVGLMAIHILVKNKLNKSLNNKVIGALPKIKNILNKNNTSSLLLIRVTGIIPFSIQNILSAYITNKKVPYVLIPLFIMSPWTLVLNYMGSKMQTYSLNKDIDVLDLIQDDYLIILTAVSYIIIFSFVIKKMKKNID